MWTQDVQTKTEKHKYKNPFKQKNKRKIPYLANTEKYKRKHNSPNKHSETQAHSLSMCTRSLYALGLLKKSFGRVICWMSLLLLFEYKRRNLFEDFFEKSWGQ